MYIKNDESLRWCDEDYIARNMYESDNKRINKSDLQKFIDYYFLNVEPCEEFVEVDAFTDWLHELSDEEIAEIVEA